MTGFTIHMCYPPSLNMLRRNAIKKLRERIMIIIPFHLKYIKGSEITKSLAFAPRFRSYLVDLIEQNRRRSRATLRIFRLRIGRRWPEAGMQKR